MGTAIAAFAILITLMVILIGAFSVILYVLGSFGLYTMAKNRGSHHAWFAWLPVLNKYLLGEVTGDRMWGFDGSKWILSIVPIALTILSATVVGLFITVPVSIAYLVYYFMVLFKLYKMYSPKNAEIYLITSIIFEFMTPIWMFMIRNNVPDMSVLQGGRVGRIAPSQDDEDIYGDIEYRENSAYQDYAKELEEEAPVTPYQHVRDTLAQMNLYTPDSDNETITIKAMDSTQMDEIESKVSSITNSLEDFINGDERKGDFDLNNDGKEEPEESEKFKLYFTDGPVYYSSDNQSIK